MYFLNVFNDGLRTIELSLCSLIYGLISFVFKVFDKLSTADILKDSTIEELISRLSLIIGLFMVFVVIFSFIKYIINPDQMIDKNKGAVSVVKKIIITIVLLGSTPFLFDTAFDIQEIMIRSNVIGKIILGKENTSSGNFGNDVSGTLFMTFYRINETPIKIDDTYTQCSILVGDLADEIALSNGDVSLAAYCLLEKNKYFVSNSAADAVNNAKDDDDKIDEYIIDFDGLLAVLAGGFFVYLGFLWTIQIGVRMFQLAYLQIISPIPILMYITPKGEEKLNKWGQQCITTFLDLFLRIAIIYFGMFLFDIINDFDFSMLFNENWKYNLYTRVILIIAVLTFIRKIPKLLQEIFPSMGGAAGFSYSLKMPDEAKQFGRIVRATTGTAIGAVAGGVTGLVHGKGTFSGRAGNAFTGVFRGAKAGATTKGNIFGNVKKGVVSQRMASQKAYERNQDGSTFFGRTAIGATQAAREKEAFEQELQYGSDYASRVDIIKKELEKSATVKKAIAERDRYIQYCQTHNMSINEGILSMKERAIKDAEKSALIAELSTGSNTKLINAFNDAEAIRSEAVSKGFTSSFTGTSLTSGTVDDRSKAFWDNKDAVETGIHEIKDTSGSRHADYKRAEANSKYQPKGS